MSSAGSSPNALFRGLVDKHYSVRSTDALAEWNVRAHHRFRDRRWSCCPRPALPKIRCRRTTAKTGPAAGPGSHLGPRYSFDHLSLVVEPFAHAACRAGLRPPRGSYTAVYLRRGGSGQDALMHAIWHSSSATRRS